VSSSREYQSWLIPIKTEEVIDLARQNGDQGDAQLDQAELLRAADWRLRERLRAAMAGTGVQLRLAEPAGKPLKEKHPPGWWVLFLRCQETTAAVLCVEDYTKK